MNSSENPLRESPSDLVGRFAVPIEVRLQIAEAKRQMAESRYQVMVRRAQSWADKRGHAMWPERTDSDL